MAIMSSKSISALKVYLSITIICLLVESCLTKIIQKNTLTPLVPLQANQSKPLEKLENLSFEFPSRMLNASLDDDPQTTNETGARPKRTIDVLLRRVADTFGYDIQKRPSVLPITPPPAPAPAPPPAPDCTFTQVDFTKRGVPAPTPKCGMTPKCTQQPKCPSPPPPAPKPAPTTPKPSPPPVTNCPPSAPVPLTYPPPLFPPLNAGPTPAAAPRVAVRKNFSVNLNWSRGSSAAPATAAPPPPATQPPSPLTTFRIVVPDPKKTAPAYKLFYGDYDSYSNQPFRELERAEEDNELLDDAEPESQENVSPYENEEVQEEIEENEEVASEDKHVDGDDESENANNHSSEDYIDDDEHSDGSNEILSTTESQFSTKTYELNKYLVQKPTANQITKYDYLYEKEDSHKLPYELWGTQLAEASNIKHSNKTLIRNRNTNHEKGKVKLKPPTTSQKPVGQNTTTMKSNKTKIKTIKSNKKDSFLAEYDDKIVRPNPYHGNLPKSNGNKNVTAHGRARKRIKIIRRKPVITQHLGPKPRISNHLHEDKTEHRSNFQSIAPFDDDYGESQHSLRKVPNPVHLHVFRQHDFFKEFDRIRVK